MSAINWYPGHMAKTRRMLQENLKMIDVVVEILDARAPMASRNPDFDDLFAGKARVVLLNKSDLADSNATKRWISYYAKHGVEAAGVSATGGSAKKIAIVPHARTMLCLRVRCIKSTFQALRRCARAGGVLQTRRIPQRAYNAKVPCPATRRCRRVCVWCVRSQ